VKIEKGKMYVLRNGVVIECLEINKNYCRNKVVHIPDDLPKKNTDSGLSDGDLINLRLPGGASPWGEGFRIVSEYKEPKQDGTGHIDVAISTVYIDGEKEEVDYSKMFTDIKQVIHQDNNTVVILKSGCEGIARLQEGDTYNRELGFWVAYAKALKVRNMELGGKFLLLKKRVPINMDVV